MPGLVHQGPLCTPAVLPFMSDALMLCVLSLLTSWHLLSTHDVLVSFPPLRLPQPFLKHLLRSLPQILTDQQLCAISRSIITVFTLGALIEYQLFADSSPTVFVGCHALF